MTLSAKRFTESLVIYSLRLIINDKEFIHAPSAYKIIIQGEGKMKTDCPNKEKKKVMYS